MSTRKPKAFQKYKQALDDFILGAKDAGLSATFIVFSLVERRFLRFDGTSRAQCIADYEEFVAREYTAHDHVPDFQEVINQRTWHALAFDIDYDATPEEVATPELYEARVAQFRESLREIVGAICDTCYDMFDIAITEDDCIVCESLDPRERARLAAHIIVTRAIPHYSIGKQCATQVISLLSARDGAMIDRALYCTQHNLRIAGCAKIGSPRIKRIPAGRALIDTIVGASLAMRIPQERAEYWRARLANVDETPGTAASAKGSRASGVAMTDDLVKRACEYVDARHGAGSHRLRRRCDSLLIFTRVTPSFCTLCNRQHDHDNTVMVRVAQEFGNIRFIESCRKYDAEHPRETSRVELGSFAIDDGIDGAIARTVTKTGTTASADTWQSRIPVDSYEEPAMRDYPEDARTLFVHAPMKIGKTKALRRFVDKFAGDEMHRAIFVSFRRTFTSEIAAHFQDFVSYRDVRGDLDLPRMIVQVESLHRIVPDKIGRVDLLILDESESIISQFESGLSGDHGGDFAVFQWLLRYSARVVALDAFLSERTCAIVGRIRGLDGARIIRNEYKNATADVYYFTSSRELWLLALVRCVENGERAVVCANSAREGRALCEMISRAGGADEIRIKYYCAETSCSIKSRDFANVRECWTECDVLIYTPTLTAGVSFEEAHFDRMFGYFTDKSCAAQVCMQMMGRVRDIAQRQFFICLNTTPGTYPVTRDDLVLSLRIKKRAICAETDGAPLDVEYTAAGLPTIPDTDYAELCVQNVIARNRSRNDFTGELVRLVTSAGARAIRLSTMTFSAVFGHLPTFDDLAEMRGMRADVGSTIELARARAIADARELEGEEYKPLADRITGGMAEIAEADRAAVAKYELRAIYDMRDEMNAQFVQMYADAGVIAAFKNLRALCEAVVRSGAGADVTRAIGDMRRMESEHLREIASDARDPEGLRELGFAGRFEMHRILHIAVGAIGFRDVFDRRMIPHVDAEEHIRNNSGAIRRIWPSLCATFKIPPNIARGALMGAIDMKLYMSAVDLAMHDAYRIALINVGDVCRLSRPDGFTIRMDNKVVVSQ